MRRSWIRAGLLAVALLPLPAPAEEGIPGTLTGHWNVTVRFEDDEVCHGPMDLEQKDGALTGSYMELDQRSAHAGKTGRLEGRIDGTRVSLTLTFADGYAATWTGTAAKDRIRGTLVNGQDQRNVWTWTADRLLRAAAMTQVRCTPAALSTLRGRANEAAARFSSRRIVSRRARRS